MATDPADRLIRLVGLDEARLAQIEALLFDSARLERVDGNVQRLTERVLAAEANAAALLRRVEILEAWAADPAAPFPHAGSRLAQLEAKLELALRRQKGDPGERGPRGFPGLKGRDGVDGKTSDTIIREVKISG